jgi:hypothetical protein
MTTLSVLDRLGNAFAALFGKHGDVTRQAHQAGCSRQTVYHHAGRVEQAVTDAQPPGPSRGQLLEENRRLRQQVQQLQRQLDQRRADTLVLDLARRQRLAALAWAMGLSLNQIADLFAALLAAGDGPGSGLAKAPERATIGHWVLACARQAGQILEVLDEQARARVRVLCLDEIFFRRQPVLMAVEPGSLAWLLGQRSRDRTGATWCAALRPFGQLEFVQSDQGTGLQAGLRLLAQERPPAATPAEARPPLRNGLDVFHIARAAHVPLAARWRRVERCWAQAEKAEAALAKARQRRRPTGGLTRRVQAAWGRVRWHWRWYEEVEAAWRRARAALELFRPDGRLNDRAWAAREIEAACRVLKGAPWKKARALLRDRRTLAFLDRMHQQLAQAEPRAALRAALVRLWRWENGPGTGAAAAAAVVARVACARLAGDWLASYPRVQGVLSQVVRASSAVECVNSIVRMQQARHRNLSQPMLDLKRLYWNCRPFRSGKRAGKCPYQHLGLALPTFDFWDVLQSDPAKLKQQLSTQKLAA